MTNTHQSFKTQTKLALDNNTLCAAIGLYEKVKALAKRHNISVADAFEEFNIEHEYVKTNQKLKAKLKALLKFLKLSWNKELRIVITPTVRSEIFDTRIVFTKIKPNMFFQDFCVEHISFEKTQQDLIDELTVDLLSPQKHQKFHDGHSYSKDEAPIEGNHNKNHDHDARIFAECVFSQTDLFTFDSDFKKRDFIYEVVKKFEHKHPEANGISKYRIIMPKTDQNNHSNKFCQHEDDFSR